MVLNTNRRPLRYLLSHVALVVAVLPYHCFPYCTAFLPSLRSRPLSFYRSTSTDSTSKSQLEDETTNTTSSSVNEYSFFDEAIVFVRAGSGGEGATSYKNIRGQQGPPDGGNGGRGGHVILQVDNQLNTLAGLSNAWRPNSMGGSGAATAGSARPKSFRAEPGSQGQGAFKTGRNGKDVMIRVPPGTLVKERVIDMDGAEVWVEIGRLGKDEDEAVLVVANGGDGGEGTAVQSNRRVKRPRISQTGGEKKWIQLTLQLVADVALVGVPNAGKSTLLASVTRAKPKIANYPFTTVIPNLGVWIPNSWYSNDNAILDKGAGSEGLVLCDVPGLIAGAAQGVGLGHAFLRHVERCHVILHLIDMTSKDPIADYEMVNRELVRYGTGQLAQMPQVVVINKMDVLTDENYEGEEEDTGLKLTREQVESKLRTVVPHSRIMWMSARESDGVDELMQRLAVFVKKVKDSKES